MGGGASRNGKRKKAGKAGELVAVADLSPCLLRRRRVLFGTADPQAFEQLEPLKQFDAAHDNDDPVFERMGTAGANTFRATAKVFHLVSVDGLLGRNTIELLGPQRDEPLVPKGSALEERLFKIGQVGRLVEKAPLGELAEPLAKQELSFSQKGWLTCYQLLALYSVIHHGSRDELLELLFCLFDVDEDDRVGLEDFQATVESYLGLMAPDSLEAKESDEFKRVKSVDRTAAARRVAELAVTTYGSAEDVPLPPPAPPSAPSGGEGERTKKQKASKEKTELAEPLLDKADVVEQPKAKAKPKRKGGCCLCKGKQPAEESDDEAKKKGTDGTDKLSDEHSDSEGSFSSSEEGRAKKKKKEEEEAAAKAEPKKKSRFSRSPRRAKADEKKTDAVKSKSKDKGAAGEDEASALIEKKAKAAAAPKKKKGGCCLCGGSKANKGTSPPPLTFEQWRNWFNDNFADFIIPEQQAAPKAAAPMDFRPNDGMRNLASQGDPGLQMQPAGTFAPGDPRLQRVDTLAPGDPRMQRVDNIAPGGPRMQEPMTMPPSDPTRQALAGAAGPAANSNMVSGVSQFSAFQEDGSENAIIAS